jgi:hypothetical protein
VCLGAFEGRHIPLSLYRLAHLHPEELEEEEEEHDEVRRDHRVEVRVDNLPLPLAAQHALPQHEDTVHQQEGDGDSEGDKLERGPLLDVADVWDEALRGDEVDVQVKAAGARIGTKCDAGNDTIQP